MVKYNNKDANIICPRLIKTKEKICLINLSITHDKVRNMGMFYFTVYDIITQNF